jgi:hypothetical protein
MAELREKAKKEKITGLLSLLPESLAARVTLANTQEVSGRGRGGRRGSGDKGSRGGEGLLLDVLDFKQRRGRRKERIR